MKWVGCGFALLSLLALCGPALGSERVHKSDYNHKNDHFPHSASGAKGIHVTYEHRAPSLYRYGKDSEPRTDRNRKVSKLSEGYLAEYDSKPKLLNTKGTSDKEYLHRDTQLRKSVSKGDQLSGSVTYQQWYQDRQHYGSSKKPAEPRYSNNHDYAQYQRKPQSQIHQHDKGYPKNILQEYPKHEHQGYLSYEHKGPLRHEHQGYSKHELRGYPKQEHQRYLKHEVHEYPKHESKGLPIYEHKGYPEYDYQGYPNHENQGFPKSEYYRYSKRDNQGYPKYEHQGYPKHEPQGFSKHEHQGYPKHEHQGYAKHEQQGYAKHQRHQMHEYQGYAKHDQQGFSKQEEQKHPKKESYTYRIRQNYSKPTYFHTETQPQLYSSYRGYTKYPSNTHFHRFATLNEESSNAKPILIMRDEKSQVFNQEVVDYARRDSTKPDKSSKYAGTLKLMHDLQELEFKRMKATFDDSDEYSSYTYGYAPTAPIALQNTFCLGLEDGNFANPGLTQDADPRCTYIVCAAQIPILFNCASGTFNGHSVPYHAATYASSSPDYKGAPHHRFAASGHALCAQLDVAIGNRRPVCSNYKLPGPGERAAHKYKHPVLTTDPRSEGQHYSHH